MTLITLMDYFIIYSMSLPYEEILESANYILYWRHLGAGSYNQNTALTGTQISMISFTVFVYTIANLRDICTGLAFIVSMFPLWKISLTFQEADSDRKRKLLGKKYRKICRLTRLFEKAHGSALFCFFINYLIYYSTKLHTIITFSVGEQFFHLQFVFIFVLVYALGASFSTKVRLYYFGYNNILFIKNLNSVINE